LSFVDSGVNAVLMAARSALCRTVKQLGGVVGLVIAGLRWALNRKRSPASFLLKELSPERLDKPLNLYGREEQISGFLGQTRAMG
jgi:hypothetical protein